MKALVVTLNDRQGKPTCLLTHNRECIQHYRPTLILDHAGFIKRMKNDEKLDVLVSSVPDDLRDEQIEQLYQALRGPDLTKVDTQAVREQIVDIVTGAIKRVDPKDPSTASASAIVDGVIADLKNPSKKTKAAPPAA